MRGNVSATAYEQTSTGDLFIFRGHQTRDRDAGYKDG